MARALREGAFALWHTGTVGALSALAVGASLLLVGLFALMVDAAQGLSASVKDRVEVDVYLKNRFSPNSAEQLAGLIAEISGVSEVTYVDKDAASKEFRTLFGDNLLDALSTNPLPASLRVRFDSSSDVTAAARAVVDAVEGNAGVESIDGGELWLSGLDQALDVATGVAIFLGVVLCVACAFAVSNTSKLMVLAQQEAIEVMHLVGATGAFVRTTFLIGGALQGVIGGVLAAIVLLMSGGVMGSWFQAAASFPLAQVAFGLVLLGLVLGVLGSWTSLNRVLQAIAS
ncbi:ABC transporter permease [bacterium]|jgi:cell division transport system permease protein|nr:ABC transporter permease [bacterium]